MDMNPFDEVFYWLRMAMNKGLSGLLIVAILVAAYRVRQSQGALVCSLVASAIQGLSWVWLLFVALYFRYAMVDPQVASAMQISTEVVRLGRATAWVLLLVAVYWGREAGPTSGE